MQSDGRRREAAAEAATSPALARFDGALAKLGKHPSRYRLMVGGVPRFAADDIEAFAIISRFDVDSVEKL